MQTVRLIAVACLLALSRPVYSQSFISGAGGCSRSAVSPATTGNQIPQPEPAAPPKPTAPSVEYLNLHASEVTAKTLGGFLFQLAQDSSFCNGNFSEQMECPGGGFFSISGSCQIPKDDSCRLHMSGVLLSFSDCASEDALLNGEMVLSVDLIGCDPRQQLEAQLDSSGEGHGGDLRVLVQEDPIHIKILVAVLTVTADPVTVKVSDLTRIVSTFGDTCCIQAENKDGITCDRRDDDDNGFADICESKTEPPPKPDPGPGSFQPCMACDSGLDCPTGVACLQGLCNIACRDDFLCESDDECSATSSAYCIGGSCNFTVVGCSGDLECAGYFGPGSFCDKGNCRPKDCSDDAECDFLGGSCGPTGFCQWPRCIDHADYTGNEGIPDDCSTRATPASSCDAAGFCSIPICVLDSDCKAFGVCVDGLCLPEEGGCNSGTSCASSEECVQQLGAGFACQAGCCVPEEPPVCSEACGCDNALEDIECDAGADPDQACESFLLPFLPPHTDPAVLEAMSNCSFFKATAPGCCDVLRPLGGLSCASTADCQLVFGTLYGGDWTCDANFTCTTVCGDRVCLSPFNETCQTCPGDCGDCPVAVCGDRSCDSANGETCSNCDIDCGVCPGGGCGDRNCDSRAGETCSNCSADCGACPGPVCGDRNCDAANGETCSNCDFDCGVCPPPPGGK